MKNVGEVRIIYQIHQKAGASLFLTWHHAVKGDGALADEVLPDGVMIPYKETHQGQLRHVNREHQSLLPHRVEPYVTAQRNVVGRGGGGRWWGRRRGRTEEEKKDGGKEKMRKRRKIET